jgi:hypothetical protein
VKVGPLAAPDGDVTEMIPVVAFVGTVVMIVVAVELITVAGVPLKFTVLEPAVVLNPMPKIVTLAPTKPEEGDNP